MASKGCKACTTCVRTVRRQSLQLQISRLGAVRQRTFTTTSNPYAESRKSNITPSPSALSLLSRSPTSTIGTDSDSKKKSATLVTMKAAAGLQKVTGKATETYTAYGATEVLYKECARQANYLISQDANSEEEIPKTEDGEDLGVGDGAGLKPTFSTWSQVTMLHMYLLSVRIRCFPLPSHNTWQQHLLDHFFHDAENRMTIYHNMHASGTRSKYLKDLFIQWRGLLAAYDEGLVKGDAVLAAAVWRNIFKANEEVDIRVLGQIVSYMRRVLKGLDSLPDEKISQATLEFGSPEVESAIVHQRSRSMDLPFENASGTNFPGGKRS
ncbi:Protein cbp3, mitochondrial [Cadophora gregata]|uniref:Protein cbp3, mitochondrial n=1 Tax=Cadophora gregata TaxID=51156 RepID=UPI0026DB5F06|nr:Protein cbp3, mitochondrial [Cadophora gregata]XP_058349145.1 Protein cbp3, mitochondrial [Cadophora gregata]KAK0099798.1 Protein cbp3, mitochondrial [Cadophora gregata]KAK0099804.1 Protein cbp3, mitochondrial [Cadophora gregata]